MSMADEQGAYNQSMNAIRQGSELFGRFMEAFTEYLSRRQEYASARAITNWIRGGGGISVYTVRGDCRDDVLQALKNVRIPYIAQKSKEGGITVFIRDKDQKACMDLNQQILDVKSNYYQSIDIERLEQSFYAYGGMPERQKQIVQLHGLEQDMVHVIKNKCNDIARGFMVGVSEPDKKGHCDIAVHAGKAMTASADQHDFCRAVFSAAVSFYGPNHDIKEKQMEADDKITEYIARLHSGNTLSDANVFLIGSYDKSRYIELTGNDFRYYEVHKNKGTGTMSQVMKFSCPKDDPSYKDELLKYCDMIPSKIVLRNIAELSDHIKDKVWIHSNRPEKNLNQEKISFMEKEMVELVDGMVRQKTDRESMIRNELFNPKQLQKKMDEYFAEVRKVMDAIGQKGTDGNNLVPEGYQKEDMDKLRQMIRDCGLSPDAYKKSMQFLEKIKPEIHKAKSPFELRREKEERQEEER